jgi:hypothetical protein
MREDDIKKSLGGGYQPHFFLVDKIVLAKIPPRAVWGSLWNACFYRNCPPPPPSSPFFEKLNPPRSTFAAPDIYVALTGFDTHAAGIEPLLHTYLTNLQIRSGIKNVILSKKTSFWSKNRTENCDKYDVKILAKNSGDILKGLVHQI